MDLARTPTLSRSATNAPAIVAPREAVLVISTAHAHDPEFVRAWEQLASNASEPNPFYEPWFVLPSVKAFASKANIELFAHFTDGQLTGLIPVKSTTDYYGHRVPHISGWLHDNAFCGAPLVLRGSERSFWRSLLAHCDRTRSMDLFLHIPRLSCDGPLGQALDAVLSEQSRPSYPALEESRALLVSDLSSEEYYVQSMSAKKRKELRRQHKRLSEEGKLSFERIEGQDGVSNWIAEFLDLEAAGWKGKAGSALASSSGTSGFFTDVLTNAAQVGKLERLSIRLDGRPVAMLANFITAPGAYSFKTTFDEAFSRYSPGLLIQLENLSLLDRENIQWADSCASEGHSMIERLWRDKRTLKSHNISIGGGLRGIIFKRLMAYETRDRSNA